MGRQPMRRNCCDRDSIRVALVIEDLDHQMTATALVQHATFYLGDLLDRKPAAKLVAALA